MSFITGGDAGDGGAGAADKKAREEEAARQARINSGMTSIDEQFNQFTPDYYAQKSDAYKSYYLPQLEDQYTDAKKKLVYGLSRHGNLNSSSGADQLGKLAQAYATQQGYIGDQAISSANDLRTDVEHNRSDLVTQLNATADPNIAAASAIERAKLLQTPQALSPLANAFSALTADFSNAVNAGQYNQNSPFYGSFGSGRAGSLNSPNSGSYSFVH